jgi:cysteine desulfurase
MVGLGEACELAGHDLEEYGTRVRSLRDRLHQCLSDGLGSDTVRLNGHPLRRLPNTLNISIAGLIGEDLLAAAPEIAASTGAACHAGSTEPSGVLLAMGLSGELALGALRLTLGRFSTHAEIDASADLIVERSRRLRAGRDHAPDYSI